MRVLSLPCRLTRALGRQRGWRAAGAALVLGLISALALPPVFAVPLLGLAIPALLALLDGAASWRGAAARGFWFGFGLHLLGLYWITDAILLESARYWWLVPLATPALAAALAPFTAAACALARTARPGWPRALALAGAWTLADLLRQFVATGFPWNPLGSAWEFPGRLGDAFIQPAAWIGAPGLTLLTLLLAATPALGRRVMAGGVAALALWAGLGTWRLASPAPPAPDVSVVLVQGNVAQMQKWEAARARDIFGRYLELTRDGVAEARARRPARTPVTVWPESASPYLLEEDAGARAALMQATGGAPALVGSVRFDAGGAPRNSLLAITGAGAVTTVYDKWHLVPFGEYSPAWLPPELRLMPGGFVAGPGPLSLHVPGLPAAGALICYEAIFPAAVVDAADRPAWLVNITNDAWFGDSSGPRQHLQAARLRAVEEGLPLLRAANTGISAGFDANGRALGRLGIDRAGVLVLDLPGALPPTVFARLGLAAPGVLAALTLLAAWSPRWLARRGPGQARI